MRFRQYISVATQLAFGIWLLFETTQLARYGWQTVPLDLSELSADNSPRKMASETVVLNQWADIYGYRLAARKNVADRYFKSQNKEFKFDDGETYLVDVLKISPFEPNYWLELARIAQLKFADTDHIIDLLRMSYITGRSVQPIMASRANLAISLWQDLDINDKKIAINDIVYGVPREEEQLTAFIQFLPASSIQELVQLIQLKDPNLSADFQRILKSKTP